MPKQALAIVSRIWQNSEVGEFNNEGVVGDSKIMAVEATGSRYTQNTNYIIAVVCILVGLYFFYDGWFGKYREKELEKNDGQPTLNLYINQYIIIPLAAIAAYCIFSAKRLKSKRIEAGDTALSFSDGLKIPYSSIKQIDKRFFEKEGHFTLEYDADGSVKRIKLKDRMYDGLGLLLDEVVRQTGAAPAETESSEGEETKTEDT